MFVSTSGSHHVCGCQQSIRPIHREKLMGILSAYGVPEKIVDAVNMLYKDTVSQVITPDGEAGLFVIIAGVL